MHLPDGIATIRDLRLRGTRDAAIRTAVRRGELVRVRQGVVARLDCSPEVVAAARIGGRVAGSSAARLRGFWAPENRRLVVEAPRGAHVPRTPALVIRGPAGPARFGVSSASDIVAQVLRTEATPSAVAILDSMLRRSSMTLADIESAASKLPSRVRRPLALLDPRAESGTESIVRVLLGEVGIRAIPQVRVPFSALERLDLVVGDRLVLECDSRAHHSTPVELDRDNARDLALTALGFLVLRVRYRVLVDDPASLVAAVRRMVDLGLHLDRSAPSRRDTPC